MRRTTTTLVSTLAALGLLTAAVSAHGADACCAKKADTSAKGESVALFNGENLDGWKIHATGDEVPDDLWTVKDGLLVTKGKPIGYIYTTDAYKDFKLVVEWRWPEGKKPDNSGVLLRIAGEPIGFMPRCVEAQLKHENAGDLYGFRGASIDGPEKRLKQITGHAALGDFTGVKRIKTAEKPVGEWNRYVITVKGKKIKLKINGEKVNEGWGLDEVAGPIGLQSEGSELHFRKVELTPLK